MKFRIKSALLLAIGVSLVLLSIAACQGASRLIQRNVGSAVRQDPRRID